MGYGRMSQAGDGPRAVPNDSSGRPQGVAPTTYPLTIHASKPKVLPQKNNRPHRANPFVAYWDSGPC